MMLTIAAGAPVASIDVGLVLRVLEPSCSNDSMISGTIAPSTPDKTIIRRSGLGDFESFGRTPLRGVAASELSRAGPNGPVKRAPGLRSLCFGSFSKPASTFRNSRDEQFS
jgi:hypothetical protein